jgi:uncharacterized protein (DUF1499 family)
MGSVGVWLRWLAFGVAALAVTVVVLGQMGLFRGKAPDNLGVRDGRLKRPSYTPNSVSSQAELFTDHPMREAARIAPLPAAPDPAAAMERLYHVVEAMPGARVVEQREDYLRVEFETRVLRFVDDAEFWVDPAARAIQLRSASRVGGKDYGVNRARIETIRAALTPG